MRYSRPSTARSVRPSSAAIRAVELSADGKLAYNPTGETLWYESNGQVSTLAPGECKAL